MRNDLAVATATVHAFADGKLQANTANLADLLAALGSLDSKVSELQAGPNEQAFGKQDLLSAIVEGSPYAKVLVDDSGRITLVNSQTEELFGYGRAELLGRPIEMLVPTRLRGIHPGLRELFRKSPEARPMGAGRELYGRRKDGSEVAIEIGLNPIETQDGAYTLAAITEITERKRAEELRLQHAGVQEHAIALEKLNIELESASRFKTQFIATMNHELRTPLSAIIGAAELLDRATLPERERISVETIHEAAESLFALISSVLDFSKIEAGKVELYLASFEVGRILEGAVDVVAELARDKGLTLNAYIDPAISRMVGDADKLRQILINLLGNAVKFTERGRVDARVYPIEDTAAGVVLRFEVQDTGIGIARDVRGRLFEPFVQGDSSASRRFGGTGLGLSICKRLVELMGGTIGIEGEPGAGSSFWFTLPFKRAAETTSIRRRSLDGVACLILSGDDTFSQIVERYVASWAMTSRRATSRTDVVEAIQSNVAPTWVAVVDTDDIGIADLEFTLAQVQVLMPARVIAVGRGGQLHKPVRQSYLFDAIARVAEVERAAPSREAGALQADPKLSSGAILVAEDDTRLQRLLKLQFDDIGVSATFVGDGLAAVDALQEGEFAMVFMDCQMPLMDGLGATRAIRESEKQTGRHVHIVAMTANAFAEDREQCIAAGMDDYLSKPVKLGSLRAMIERWSKPVSHDENGNPRRV